MMAQWIQKPTKRKLGLAPRGHLKSTIWTVADSLRRVTKDPELQILIVNEKEDNIIKWVHVMQEVVMSDLYKGLFPERVPNPLKVRWNATQLELKRPKAKPQANIEGMGITSAITSNHYDIIKADDLVGDDAKDSLLTMQAAIDKRKRMDSVLISSNSEIHDVCTRWGPHDPADWVMKSVPNVDILKLSVWKQPGVPWFPGTKEKPFFPAEYLEQIRVQYGPKDWALLYLNEIVGGDATRFNPDLLRFWTLEKVGDDEYFILETPLGTKRVKREDCWGFQIIDAGLNPESPDARTANVVGFCTPPTTTEPFDIVIAEAKATRSTPAQVVEESFATYKRWQPMFAGIETFGGHQAFFGWISQTYPGMRITQLKKDFSRNAKHKRINGFWGSYPNQGRVYVQRAMSDLFDELISYPTGATVDLLDAAGYLPTVWAPPEIKKPGLKRRPGVSDFDLSDYDPEEIARATSEGVSPLTGY